MVGECFTLNLVFTCQKEVLYRDGIFLDVSVLQTGI